MGAERLGAIAITIGSKGYCGTGNTAGPGYYPAGRKDWWEYDPESKAWTQKADFGGGQRNLTQGCGFATKGYIGGGKWVGGVDEPPPPQTYFHDWWEYNPSGNTWTQKTDIPGTNRANASCWSINNKGYVGLGVELQPYPDVYFSDLQEYNPDNDTWTARTSFPGTARRAMNACVVDSKAYMGGSGNFFTSDWWEYNPDGHTWTQKADQIGDQVKYSVTVTSDVFALFGTGRNSAGYPTNDFYTYDPSTNLWDSIENFPGARYYACSFTLDGNAYVGTGWSGVPQKKDWYKYKAPGIAIGDTVLCVPIYGPKHPKQAIKGDEVSIGDKVKLYPLKNKSFVVIREAWLDGDDIVLRSI
jgi:N-acetylneuraminic acid mutarotase